MYSHASAVIAILTLGAITGYNFHKGLLRAFVEGVTIIEDPDGYGTAYFDRS